MSNEKFVFLSWFSLTPPPLASVTQQVWGALALACVITGILVQRLVVRRRAQSFERRPWIRVVKLLIVNGMFLWALLFFRYEGVPFFGAAFWLIVLCIGDIAWIVAIVRAFRRVPAQQRAWAEEQKKRKYLR